MRKILATGLVITSLGLLTYVYAFKKEEAPLRSGDVIFQTSMSPQCQAVRLATHSRFSHCGMIWKIDNKDYVLEAVQPVKITPLDEWISHGDGKKYVVRRLKNADKVLTDKVLSEMEAEGKKMIGKPYDGYFEWSDDRIYCSELIWKIYKRAAGVAVGRLQKIKDFDLSSGPVKEIIRERYGDNLPINETVISPQSIYESSLFVTVRSKYGEK
ncbi:YiiX family permuted papain-like enzyme [Chitinophaga agri]|uniref:YiiX family permuted papain-like enzyme n=1 Tax=Chitinophaga agri TaxID=2703787 RepID=A0A6B9ZHT4_9BACT|nr:YiiX family permuted papain-like enzyme [Chitinophaga agri]QHS60894.1 YiiX family permuted papain-like enzyme [Chitinophaga agri]